MYRERQIACVIVLFAIAGLLPGCGEGQSGLPGREGGRATKIPVSAVVIRPQPLESKIFTTGTLLANEEVELRPELSGRVTGVFFQEGGSVTKGQLLLKINDSELRAQLKRKEAEEKIAQDDGWRKKRLYDIKGISEEEYDRSVNALKMIQAEKEIIQSQLAKTEIVAPFDGVIGLRYVGDGTYVTGNMLAATMQDIDPMKVEFSVPEKYAGQIRKGAEIAVRAGDSPEEYRGKLYAVESKIDLSTRTIKARATIPNPRARLIPGSFAKVEITLERIRDAIVIPAEAVIPELSGEKVFICQDGKARSVPVKTGLRTETGAQIVEGLSANDTLLTTGLLQIADGTPVEIRELNSQ